ncbi:MAG: restriction endonuclease subunit S [Candidatus Thiodiazotropha endolucinida]
MVPEGWKKDQIGNHVELLSGYPFKSENYLESGVEGIRLLRGDNIGQNFLRWRDAKHWPAKETEGLERYQLRKGDFVIAMDRTWISAGLKVAEVTDDDIPSLLVQRVSRLRAKKTLEQGLLRQIFSSHRFQQYVKSVQTETAVPHISAQQIKEFTFLAPPEWEGRKIAQILTTWDKAIEKTEQLIQNSNSLKNALMRRLLSGEKRLTDFDDHWKQYTLSELGSTYGGLTSKTKDDFGTGEPFIPYKNVFLNSRIDTKSLDHVKIREDENQATVAYGDVLFTTSSETPDEVGMSSVLLDNLDNLYLNSFCFGYRLNDFSILSPRFARYLLRGNHFRRAMFRLAQGSTRYNISKADVLKIRISLPSIEEQEAISDVLDECTNLREKESEYLSRLRAEKTALAQQLLTGKRRVPLSKEA